MRCQWTQYGGQRIFIPGCYGMLHRDPEDRKYFCTCYDTPRKLRKISQVKKLKQENKRLRAVIKKLNQPEETGK